MATRNPTGLRHEMTPRDRLIEGVLDTIAEYGVEGLTHRRVAELAGASLSATTYYFATLDEMLYTALRTSTERDIAQLRERFVDRSPTQINEMLVAYVEDALGPERRQVAVLVELYAAAARHEPLRELVVAWEEAWAEFLAPAFGRAAAELISVAIGGMLGRALVFGELRGPDETGAQIRLLLERMAPSDDG